MKLSSLVQQILKYEYVDRRAFISLIGTMLTAASPVSKEKQRKATEEKEVKVIKDKLKKIIVEQLGVEEEEVVDDASFIDDLGGDSLDHVELIMAVEEEFNIDIPDAEAERIDTVQSAVSYIHHRIKGSGVLFVHKSKRKTTAKGNTR